jgi:ParE toxin of type II toxin-antitoxin system, parDE
VKQWRDHLGEIPSTARLAAWPESGLRLIAPGDPEWPTQLDDLGDARPLVLWARGAAKLRLNWVDSVSIVAERGVAIAHQGLLRLPDYLSRPVREPTRAAMSSAVWTLCADYAVASLTGSASPLTGGELRDRRQPLRDDLAGVWSARRGTYRVLYRIREDLREVIVLRIEHRRDGYWPL